MSLYWADPATTEGAPGSWYLALTDNTNDVTVWLDVAAGCNFAEGLATATYTFAADYSLYTIYPGVVEDGYFAGGSGVFNVAMNGLYDLCLDGEVDVTNNGDGSYKIDVAVSGTKYEIVGTYEGTPTGEDYTAEEVAPAKVRSAKAPLKAAQKSISGVKFNKDATYQPLAGRSRI